MILSSDLAMASSHTGEFFKYSIDDNGRVTYKQDKGDSVLYANGTNHWMVGRNYIAFYYNLFLLFSAIKTLSSKIFFKLCLGQ